jgi:hypothetical protein
MGSSCDELSISLSQSMANLDPDPFLVGVPPRFQTFPSTSQDVPVVSFSDTESAPPTPNPADRREEPALANNPEFPFLPPSNDDSVERIGLGVDVSSRDGDRPRLETASEAELRSVDDLDSSGETDFRSSWSSSLLFSYASAVTLALVWVLWTGRSFFPTPRGAAEPSVAEAEAPGLPEPVRPDPIEDRTEPLALPATNRTSLGQPLLLGSLEITPLGVEVRRVELVHTIVPHRRRFQNAPSLVLSLHVANRDEANAFAPIDRAFVREIIGTRSETFVETGSGRLEMFPLAIESEWSIQSQSFPVLEPGEEADIELATGILTEPDLQLAEPLTWILHVRTTPFRTDLIGVRFQRDQVRIVDEPGPTPEDGEAVESNLDPGPGIEPEFEPEPER